MCLKENLIIDLTGRKGKLYQDGKLMFMGDGYRCITMMVRNSKDNVPVREKFSAQLTTREKCKLTLSQKTKAETSL